MSENGKLQHGPADAHPASDRFDLPENETEGFDPEVEEPVEEAPAIEAASGSGGWFGRLAMLVAVLLLGGAAYAFWDRMPWNRAGAAPAADAEAVPEPIKAAAPAPARERSRPIPSVIPSSKPAPRAVPALSEGSSTAPRAVVSEGASAVPGTPARLVNPAAPGAIAGSATGGPGVVGTSVPGVPGLVRDCQLTLIDEAEVPAQEAGVLRLLATPVLDKDGKQLFRGDRPVYREVKEGLEVTKGDFLGQIDDTQVQKARDVAQYKLDAAMKEAGNDVNVRYARTKSETAKAEVDQAEATNRQATGAITPFELRRLKLSWAEAVLQIEQAGHEMDVNGLKAKVSQAELDAAAEDIVRRKIVAPLNGMVVKRFRHEGEWVRPGDPVFQIVRLDRLRIQAFLDAAEIDPREVADCSVKVEVTLAHGVKREFKGQIVFVNPNVEADGRFLIHAEVDNRQENNHWLLRPGQRAEMRVELRQ